LDGRENWKIYIRFSGRKSVIANDTQFENDVRLNREPMK
jgi:hypothetical protein